MPVDRKEKPNYKETFYEFIVNSSLAGLLHLGSRQWTERYIWYVIHLLSISITIFLIIYTWDNFMTNPVVTTVESIGSKSINIPMPGLSICTVNKISKRKATKYAEYLSSKSGVPTSEILNNISLLGYLYEYNLPRDPDRIIHFQKFLEKYDFSESGFYNTTDKLYKLQPSCEETVTNCKWQGKSRVCSDIFVKEYTMDGFCCIFNYLSRRNGINISPVILEHGYKPLPFTSKNQISFNVESNESDILFTTIATAAPIKILISLHTDFPDTTSGGLIEQIIDRGTKVVLSIAPMKTVTTSEVKKYPKSKRKCLFPEEATTIFGSYSYSDCIMDCKIESIIALCQCIPYNYIKLFAKNQYYQCTLADLTCLNSYSNKWKTLYPTEYKGKGLGREKQDSIQCSHCVPSCSDTMYDVSSDNTEIYVNESRANFSVVVINFEKTIGFYNKQDVYYYWYDMISMFGGLCSITMGLSFISIFEIIYYFIYLIVKQCYKSKESK